MTALSRGARVQADIAALLRARHSLLWVVTREEARVEKSLLEAAAQAKLKTRFWDCATGLSSAEDGDLEAMPNPSAVLGKIRETGIRAVYVLRDFHKWLGDPFVLRDLRSLARFLQDVPPAQARAVFTDRLRRLSSRKDQIMRTTVIRPGFLIGLKSTTQGGVEYRRTDLPAEQADTSGSVARWETTRVVYDPAEHEAAGKARNAARAEITKLCSSTSFGLLCPLDKETELDAAIKRAQGIAAEFNKTAKFTRINVYALKGRIAETDEQAARAIASEIQGLIALMTQGIDKLDPATIRESANKARELAAMLGADEQVKVTAAIEQARKAARMIVARVEKKGEEAAIVLADVQRGALERARIAFLDFSDAPSETGEAMPVANVARMSGLDVETAESAEEVH